MLFDAHNHAFRVFGGVPRRGIYDNMRTAIDNADSDEAAPLFRHDCAPGFRDDLAPWG
jgi:transposase